MSKTAAVVRVDGLRAEHLRMADHRYINLTITIARKMSSLPRKAALAGSKRKINGPTTRSAGTGDKMARDNLARVSPVGEAVAPNPVNEEVLIHVRFFPSSEINSIGEKPAHLTANAWYELLLEKARPHYQTFAGGRGFFRIPRPRFEAILKDTAA
ncbi:MULTISPECIES: hypothetical protein [unclassified Bradyrhizobium]|uniref:hypothetical protein n=1 Tax=unclassified Bradyrhizobium TaxID=2631580 RepID=UPI0028EED6A6|nr:MULTISPECIES: hypothetical protein [unclassified Bradyrhizobium]